MPEKTLHNGQARLIYGLPNIESLRSLDADSVHCVITSPPYWGLRDYGDPGQLGLEATPQDFVASMVAVFDEVRRVLHPSGTLWLNLGDSYNAKQLAGIPWRVAFALQAAGWWLRQEVIWHKPNPMPASCTDRCTTAAESILLLTKAPRYFFDAAAISEAASAEYATKGHIRPTDEGRPGFEIRGGLHKQKGSATRNRRNVWTIPTQAYAGAHFAVFPEAIPRLCILAGTSEAGVCSACLAPYERQSEKVGERQDRWASQNNFDGYRERQTTAIYQTTGWAKTCACADGETVPATVLDPFSGSGTTGKVALQLGRRYVGLDVNADYLDLALRRVDHYQSDDAAQETQGQQSLFDGVDQ